MVLNYQKWLALPQDSSTLQQLDSSLAKLRVPPRKGCDWDWQSQSNQYANETEEERAARVQEQRKGSLDNLAKTVISWQGNTNLDAGHTFPPSPSSHE